MENEIKDYDEARVIPSSKLSTQLKYMQVAKRIMRKDLGDAGLR